MLVLLFLQSDDYISLKVGPAAGIDDSIGALLLGDRVPVGLPIIEDQQEGQDPNKILTEAQLPPYPANATPVDGAWQTVGNTR